MPQMCPMNWLLLFLYFILMMVLIISFIYFIYLLKSNNSIKKMYMMELNWMW